MNNIELPDCGNCHQNFFAFSEEKSHSFIKYKEYHKDKKLLKYPNQRVVHLIDSIHFKLYKYLDENGLEKFLENKFKQSFINSENLSFCQCHDDHNKIIDKCVRLTIYKYLRDKNSSCNKRKYTDGHSKKIKKFKQTSQLNGNAL